MGRYHRGFPRLRKSGLVPRLFLHEKNEKRIRWVLRALTVAGILSSLVALPWYQGLLLAAGLAVVDVFLEKTLFYYTSLYVQPLPDFKYDSDKWVANCFLSLGEPEAVSSEKIVGLVFNDKQYAAKFFDLLRAWNYGESEDVDGNICLSFITDDDMYYVYLYASFDRRTVKRAHNEVRKKNELPKYGKEHFGLIFSLIICKGFETKHGYALGTFTRNNPPDKPFLLGPFIAANGSKTPEPLYEIEPVRLHSYKAKTPSELTEDDFEYVHWRKSIRR